MKSQAIKTETKKASVKNVANKTEVKKVSLYTENVINVNTMLKKALASVGAVRSMLLEHKDAIKLDVKFVAFLELTKKDKLAYEVLNTATRRTKTGKVPPFYVLQALYKIGKNSEVASAKTEVKPTVKKAPTKSAKLSA